MAVEYHLRKNHMNPKSGTYFAESRCPRTYTLEDIFDMMTEEGSTITKAEAMANFETITRITARLLRQGCAVQTPLVNFRPGIGGIFESEQDEFDPGRHKKKINTSPGVRIRKDVNDFAVRKVAPRTRRPSLRFYYDNGSGTKNRQITPGKGARIKGSLLKFDESDERQGIFFVNTKDLSTVRVELEVLKNKPRELIFLNPELPAGSWRLEVRSIVKHASTVRTGVLETKLIAGDEG